MILPTNRGEVAMANPSYQPVALDDSKLECLQGLEAKLGKVLVALQPRASLAGLTDAEIREIQEAEQQLGVVLVAYEGS